MFTFTFISLVVGHIFLFTAAVSEEEMLVVKAVENTNVTLNCTAILKPGVDYRAVRWYKEGGDPRLTGLVSRSPPTGEQRWYVDADTRISVEVPSLSLLLPPVSCNDSGIYQCYMAAPVGEQNREGRVRLDVLGCPTDPPIIPEGNSDDDNVVICLFPYRRQSKNKYVGAGVVGLLFSGLLIFIFFLRFRTLKKAKSLEKEPYPNTLPEKQEPLWITTLGPVPTKTGISLA